MVERKRVRHSLCGCSTCLFEDRVSCVELNSFIRTGDSETGWSRGVMLSRDTNYPISLPRLQQLPDCDLAKIALTHALPVPGG